MRVLVTGATGFVGRWLMEDLAAAGHEPVATPPSRELDVLDADALARFVDRAGPESVVHLAGVAYAPDAARDPERAFAVNEGGTRTLLEVVARSGAPRLALVAGSAEVYGRPADGDLPLHEGAPVHPEQPYGRSKLAQERAALEVGAATGLAVAVTRTFNLAGPGQRSGFVAPALAGRILRAREEGTTEVRVGNLDVERDLGDVRDAARAYRLILEGLADGRVPAASVLNVATGRRTTIRRLFEMLCSIIGVSVRPRIDPDLVRAGEPPVIVGDSSRLQALTGWTPVVPLDRTLADLVAWLEAEGRPAVGVPAS